MGEKAKFRNRNWAMYAENNSGLLIDGNPLAVLNLYVIIRRKV